MALADRQQFELRGRGFDKTSPDEIHALGIVWVVGIGELVVRQLNPE